MLLSRAAETIRRYRMFEPGQHVGVAVSGGADSVCLLHLLLELVSEWNLRLTVLHLNHGLRGEESTRDEQFVRDLAEECGLPATVNAEQVAAYPGNLEQAAREARLRFFREQMANGDISRVAVGHTRNDQAETVLFRFLRGSAGSGLAGIRPVTGDGVVRPLLEISRPEVEQYLRERNISWREDSSNASLQFARNRIRRQLLPQLEREWNPAIVDTLNRAADWALAEEEYWEGEIARLAGESVTERANAILVPVSFLRGLPQAPARRLVRYVIQRSKGDLRGVDFGHIAGVLKMAHSQTGHGHLHLPSVDVVRSFDWLRFTPSGGDKKASSGYCVAAPVPGTVQLPGTGIELSLELIEKAETFEPPDCVYNKKTDFVDWGTLSGRLEFRNWRAGDRYQPQGSTSEEKIKILFQKARIPSWERRCWPVLTDGQTIVWVRHFGAALRFAPGPECAVRLRIGEVQTPSREFGIGITKGGV